jgi:hypothetical protein
MRQDHRIMRMTLDVDDDVLSAARALAARDRRSLGSVVSELARRGLMTARVNVQDGLPVIRVPARRLARRVQLLTSH